MTPRSRFDVPLAVASALQQRRFAARAAMVAVPMAAALLLASTTIVRPPRSDAIPSAAVPAPGRKAVVPAAQVNFDRIGQILARRYRVSTDATVEVVRTAYREAHRNGVDPLLVLAVMAIESSFNPIAESAMGAVGLMQIVPRFHQDKLATRRGSVFDPRVNIEVGTQVLREYIRRAGTETAGLQLYNGSPDDPANAYANKVMTERERLRQAIRRADDRRA